MRDAARYASRCNASFSGYTCNVYAQNIAAFGTHDGSGTARVAGWAASDVIVTYYNTVNTQNADGTQDYRGKGANVTTVRVTVQIRSCER